MLIYILRKKVLSIKHSWVAMSVTQDRDLVGAQTVVAQSQGDLCWDGVPRAPVSSLLVLRIGPAYFPVTTERRQH